MVNVDYNSWETREICEFCHGDGNGKLVVNENKKQGKGESVVRNKGVSKINYIGDFNNFKNVSQMEAGPSGAHRLENLDGCVKGFINGLNGSKSVG